MNTCGQESGPGSEDLGGVGEVRFKPGLAGHHGNEWVSIFTVSCGGGVMVSI